MTPDLSHEERIALIDAFLDEPVPTGADDIAGELAAMVLEYRDARETERPR